MWLCSVFSKSPINVLSYVHNLKNKKESWENEKTSWPTSVIKRVIDAIDTEI